MSILAQNIRLLRTERSLSQSKLAEQLSISREILSKYEQGRSEPPIPVLKRMSSFFAISIDLLVGVDLKKISDRDLMKLAGNRVLLPIQVAANNENMIEVVTYTASAGYLAGYADPEFIEQLQTIQLPMVDSGKLRAFPIKGDSMLPLQDGSYVVGRFLEDKKSFKNGKTYIVVTWDEGIVFKRVFQDQQQGLVVMSSDNVDYDPYSVSLDEVVEMWEFTCSISLREPNPNPPSIEEVIRLLTRIQKNQC